MHRHPVVFQGKDDFFHRHVPLEDESTGIEQHKTRHQAQDKMAVVGVFTTGLTRLSGQEVLEGGGTSVRSSGADSRPE